MQMKRILLPLTALSAVLLSASVMVGQTGPAPAAKQQKLQKVATINGAQAVRNFEHDVAVMQAERQAVLDAKTAFDGEKDPKKKKDLQAKLDVAVEKLNKDNALMYKAYGFSILRNYSMEIESANIYLVLTDEEAAKLEADEKAKAKK